MQRTLWNRFVIFLLWLLAAGCAVYWVLKFVQGPAAPLSAAVAAPVPGVGQVDAVALAKGLGGGQAPAATNSGADSASSAGAGNIIASRFQLTGVIAKTARAGAALIGIDGKPARPYRVGSMLTDGVVLHSVAAGKAMLATSTDAAPSVTLELPKVNTALVGNVAPSRPPLPVPAPNNPMPTPGSITSNATQDNPMAIPGQRPIRPLASRGRGADKDNAPLEQPAAAASAAQ